MAREVRLWEWLRDGLKPIADLHMRRVENLVMEGDPDVQACWQGRYFELELKGCDRPVRVGSILIFEVRRAQAIYHRKRWRCGGCNWFYVRVGRDQAVARYLVPGIYAKELEAGVTEAQLAGLSVMHPGHSVTDLLNRASHRGLANPS